MTTDSGNSSTWTLESYERLSAELAALRSTSVQSDPKLVAFAQSVLNREAYLLDAGEFEAWYAMMTSDSIYWIPAEPEASDPLTNVCLAFDDNRRLDDRVYWLRTGLVSAQIPASRTSRIIGNVEAWMGASDVIFARSTFHLQEFRAGRHRLLSGHYGHVIVGDLSGNSSDMRIRTKVTRLIDADAGHDNLTLVF